MSVVLFVTDENASKIAEFAAKVGKMKQSYPGQLMVVHPTYFREDVDKIIKPMVEDFAGVSYWPVQVSLKADLHMKLSTLVAMFMIAGFHMVPGPKLIIDRQSNVRRKSWLDDMMKGHKMGGKPFTGRFAKQEASVMPVGPFVVEADHNTLKALRFPGNQDWRYRGRWLFARSHCQMPPKQFPFNIEEIEEEAPPTSEEESPAEAAQEAENSEPATP